MKIAVTTPTGHVGRVVVERLLDAGADLRLLVRDPARLRLTDRQVRHLETARGSLGDKAFVIDATRGVDVLFWATPPCMTSNDVSGTQVRMAKAAAAAIEANEILRVVNLSCLGAQRSWGGGSVSGLHEVEEVLDQAAISIRHLRPAYFFENYLLQLAAISQAGRIRLPVAGAVRFPMIAASDVAEVAAVRLLDADWEGYGAEELHGAADLSFSQAATLISEGIGRKVVHVKASPEEALAAMEALGFSEDAAELALEYYEAIEAGLLRPTEPRSAGTTTGTTLLAFAHEVLAPLLPAAVGP